MWISRREYERLCDAERTVDLLISENKTLFERNKTLFERMDMYRCSAESWKRDYLTLTDITWKKEMTSMSTEYHTNGTAKVDFMTCYHIMETTNALINTVPVEGGVWRCYEATCTLCGERGEVRMKEEMTTMKQPQYAPSNDENNNLDTEITKLRELLSTPNLTPETIEETNKNLQYLLAQKRDVSQRKMEVWQDGK